MNINNWPRSSNKHLMKKYRFDRIHINEIFVLILIYVYVFRIINRGNDFLFMKMKIMEKKSYF